MLKNSLLDNNVNKNVRLNFNVVNNYNKEPYSFKDLRTVVGYYRISYYVENETLIFDISFNVYSQNDIKE